MTKLPIYIILFFTGIFLQFTVTQYLSIQGLAPNIVLMILIYIALIKGPMAGQLLGFVFGLSWDIYSVDLFGCHTFAFTFIGFATGQLSKKLDEEKISSQIVIAFAASVLYWLLIYLCYRIFNPEIFVFKANYIIMAQPLYNVLIAPVVFKVLAVAADVIRFDHRR